MHPNRGDYTKYLGINKSEKYKIEERCKLPVIKLYFLSFVISVTLIFFYFVLN